MGVFFSPTSVILAGDFAAVHISGNFTCFCYQLAAVNDLN